MPSSLLILLMPFAMFRRWPSVAAAALQGSDRASVTMGSLAFGFILTVGLWAMGAGLSEPYPTFAAYIRSTLHVPPGLVVLFAISSGFWAILLTILMRSARRATVLDHAEIRLAASSPLQLVPWIVVWAPLRVLAHVQGPGFGLAAGKPRWLVDSIPIAALGSMWAAAAGLSVGILLLVMGLLRFDRAAGGVNCLWCQYPRRGLTPTARCPECGRSVCSDAPGEPGSEGFNLGPADPASHPACPACLPAARG